MPRLLMRQLFNAQAQECITTLALRLGELPLSKGLNGKGMPGI